MMRFIAIISLPGQSVEEVVYVGAGPLSARYLFKIFLMLWLFTAAGIILHELGHHLFGIPSAVSLSRNLTASKNRYHPEKYLLLASDRR